MAKIDKFKRSMPKIYKAGANPVLTAFLEVFAESDEEIVTQLDETKAQLFVRTAEGQPLDQLANSLGVSRPIELGLDDPTYQELIPNLSLKAKQIRKSFYDTSDVFWGPLFSRANIETGNASTFNVVDGDLLHVKIDNREEQTIVILNGDIQVQGAATDEEIVAILNRIKGATAQSLTDAISGDVTVSLRTDTPGPLGAIEIFSDSTMAGSLKLNLPITKTELRDQAQRVMIYEIRPNELLIEIPAIVPALRRTLKGSHHFHADSTIESPVPTANGVWQGSFMFNPTGSESTITVTSQNAKLEQALQKGQIYTSLLVDDTSKITDTQSHIVLSLGTKNEEAAIRIRGIPNNKTILIDPSYIFQKDHAIGDYINVVSDLKAFQPSRSGNDLAVYMTSPSGAREAVQEILKTLAAAGVILNFVVLAPDYKYLIDNPYISDDDNPTAC